MDTARSRGPRRLTILASAAVLIVSGCASATTGQGAGSGAPSTPVPSISTPATTAATTSTPPSSVAPSTSSTPPTACAGGADFCDDFAAKSSGWDSSNVAHYYAQYDPYLGGTYRLGERRDATLTEQAPYDITRAAADYSVRLSVDMVIGPKSPANAEYGLTCWNHDATGGDHSSAFLFFVRRTGAEIVLWDDTDGSSHRLAAKQWTNVLRNAPSRNRLGAVCLQRSVGGSTVAELGLSVNGRLLLKSYPKTVRTSSWTPANRVGLLVAGPKSDVFYDNFTITGACTGASC